MCMCTEAKSCVLHLMNYCADLLQLKTRAVDHPVLGKVPRVSSRQDYEYLDIWVELEQIGELWRPILVLTLHGASPTAAQLWTWLDTMEEVGEAVIRVQAACDRQVPWTTDEIKEAMADWENWKREVQAQAGGALAHLLGNHEHPGVDEA